MVVPFLLLQQLLPYSPAYLLSSFFTTKCKSGTCSRSFVVLSSTLGTLFSGLMDCGNPNAKRTIKATPTDNPAITATTKPLSNTRFEWTSIFELCAGVIHALFLSSSYWFIGHPSSSLHHLKSSHYSLTGS